MTEKEEIVKKWVDDLVENGFMSGWFGDKSDKFKEDQCKQILKSLDGDSPEIRDNYSLLAKIYSDCGNLKQYCGWKSKDLTKLLSLFGFQNTTDVLIAMRQYQENKVN